MSSTHAPVNLDQTDPPMPPASVADGSWLIQVMMIARISRTSVATTLLSFDRQAPLFLPSITLGPIRSSDQRAISVASQISPSVANHAPFPAMYSINSSSFVIMCALPIVCGWVVTT
jgi:hypothetical protein